MIMAESAAYDNSHQLTEMADTLRNRSWVGVRYFRVLVVQRHLAGEG